MAFGIIGTKIAGIDLIDNPGRIAEADLAILDELTYPASARFDWAGDRT
jgi:hypothetical protein